MAPTPRPTGSQTAAVTPAAGSDLMPPPPARTPAGAALPRRGVVRQPPAVTPDVATTPAPSPAATPTDAMPPPPALTSAPAPRGVKRPRAADASSDRKRPRAVTPRDRFVGSRLDDAGEAYRAHAALALAPRLGAQPVLNASLRNSLLPRRTGTRFLSFGSDRAAPEADAAAAERTLAVVRAAASATAARWRDLKFERCVDAPDVRDDYYSQLIDWSPHGDLIAVGMADDVYVASATEALGQSNVVMGWFPEKTVSSVAWSPGGDHIAVAALDGSIMLLDAQTAGEFRTLGPVHEGRVGALHWNPVTRCLTSGSADRCICDVDPRCPSVVSTWHADVAVSTWRLGHDGEVCGLRWRDDGRLLASGGNDNTLLIWDARRSQSPCISIPLAHRAAVKALAWCPTRHDVLASGGGTKDKRIRLWNSHTGASLASCDAEAQVTGLSWAPNGTPEVVASLGYNAAGLSAFRWSKAVNRLDCVARIKRPDDHRMVGMAVSPDRTRFAALSTQEVITYWHLYGAPGGRRSAFSAVQQAYQRRGDVRRWDGVFGGGPGQVLR